MKRRICITITALLVSVTMSFGQEYLDWAILADVKFEDHYSKEYKMDLLKANFGDIIKQYDGKEVMLTGYMIPIDPMGTAYVLSRNPNSSCFFCGGAGPETIVGLRLAPKHTKRYKTDEFLTFKGTLKLNELNEKQFTYMILDAERL